MDYRKIIKEIGRGKIMPAIWILIPPGGFTPGCWMAMCPILNWGHSDSAAY
jgi:hypothetical protein